MDMLENLYRECSLKASCPNHWKALAVAASILGSRGTPAHQVRSAITHLEAAFAAA